MTRRGGIRIPDSELTWRFSRSSGPGGQHVNTTDTRVELTWSLDETTVLTKVQKDAASAALKGRLTGGNITVVGSRYRSQTRNREDAKARLEQLVGTAIVPPRQRHRTRPTRASVERRLTAKRRQSERKRDRRGDWE